MSSYDLVIKRSGGRCEAMVQIGPSTWTRCGRGPVHIHHRLRRSHGGELLDAVNETHHLSVLCATHHGMVHSGEMSTGHGLFIEGDVYDTERGPVYVGPDEYLEDRYGPEAPHAAR